MLGFLLWGLGVCEGSPRLRVFLFGGQRLRVAGRMVWPPILADQDSSAEAKADGLCLHVAPSGRWGCSQARPLSPEE